MLAASLGAFHAMPLCAARGKSEFVYLLKPRESLWTVSQSYLAKPKNWAELRKHNRVGADRRLPPGTKIRIPVAWLKEVPLAIEVIYLTGKAQWFPANAGPAKALTVGARLHGGDRIRTETQSQVSLRLPDGSHILVSQLSELSVDAAAMYFGTNINKILIRLSSGRLETQVAPQLERTSRYEITTPTAQMGVRGTRFRASIGGGDLQRSISEVEHGMVAVNNPTLPNGAEVDLNEGFATIVRAGEAPLAFIPMLPAPDLSSLANLLAGPELNYAFAPIAGAIAYRVQLSLDPQFRTLLSERMYSGPYFRFRALQERSYYLRVRAMDVQGIEGRDASVAFQVKELQV